MFLLCIKVPTRVFDEVFQFVVRRAYIFIEGLSVVPSAPRVCTIQVSLQYNSVVLFIQFSVVVHISVCPMGLAAVNCYIFINWNVVPVGVCA